MTGLFAVTYAIVAYAAFLVTMLYAIGFGGNWGIPKSIDTGATRPLIESGPSHGLDPPSADGRTSDGTSHAKHQTAA